jgi:hypothetical protein
MLPNHGEISLIGNLSRFGLPNYLIYPPQPWGNQFDWKHQVGDVERRPESNSSTMGELSKIESMVIDSIFDNLLVLSRWLTSN